VRKRERNRRSLRSAALRSRRQLCCESWGRFSMENESSHSHNLSSRPEESWACGPPKVMKKRLLSEAALPWERRPHPCHLDRSAPGFPASLPWTRPRVRLSLRKGAYCSPAQPTSTGNPGERSGEISVLTPLLGSVFRQSVAERRDLCGSFSVFLTHSLGLVTLLGYLRHSNRAERNSHVPVRLEFRS